MSLEGPLYLVRAAGIADAEHALFPAALLVRPSRGVRGRTGLGWTALAVGRVGEVQGHPAAAGARWVDLSNAIVISALVNAHTHLDLTHIGPRRHDPAAGFVPWVDVIRRERRLDDEGIAESVRRGIELSLAGGVVAVGDIAGAVGGDSSLAPWQELAASPLGGVSYLEFFAIGRAMERRRATLADGLETWVELNRKAAEEGRAGIGLQPHAPNTVDRRVFRWVADAAARLSGGVRLATHLAETPEEREFIERGTGPQRDLLERLGAWDDSVLEEVGRGAHPVGHMEDVLRRAPFLVAHVNDAGEEGIRLLAETGTAVAYCPRASEYFGAERHFGPHRYREMLDAGVNVCLGTDSIVNLPESALEPGAGGISVLHEMRRLFRRDGTDSSILLRMGTVNGARALGLDPGLFRFTVGSASGSDLAGLVAIELSPADGGRHARGGDGLAAAMRSDSPPVLLSHEKLSRLAGRTEGPAV
jgi:cytosine/adenosine deaminase-related metal-dependent hydrolase